MNKSILLGELLTSAGILTPEMLEDALQRSKETQLPLGKVVTWSGYLNDRQLQAAVEAQSLINDHLLSLEVGIKALKLVLSRRQSFESALDEIGWAPGEVFQRNRLGDLLLASDLISEEQLNEALRTAKSTTLPLGQVLTCMPLPQASYVHAGLTAQGLIREGKITREQAIDALRLAKEHEVSFDHALLELGIREAAIISSVELSELLLNSGVVTQAQMMCAMDKSLEFDLPLSKCLVEQNYLTENTLQAARELKKATSRGSINRHIALFALQRVHKENLSAAEAVLAAEQHAAMDIPTISALDLVRLAALVTSEDVRKILPQDQGGDSWQEMPRKLLVKDSIDESTFNTLMDCLQLIERNTLTLQQAIVALHICLRRKVPLSEALDVLGIDKVTVARV